MGEQQAQSQDAPVCIWLDARIVIIEGASAAEFLQGYLTSDTQLLSPGDALPMAICNIKGRVLASGWALCVDNGIGLLVHHSVAERIAQLLRPYLNFSSATLASEAPQYVRVHQSQGARIYDGVYVAPLAALPEAYTDASNEIAASLVDRNFPVVSADVSEQFLPQMLDLHQHGAVDFDKGCYLGQEIVARAQHRGTIKRRLQRVTLDEPNLQVGDAWHTDGTVVGVAGTQALVVAKGSA